MTPPGFLFKRQGWHVLALAILVPVTWLLAEGALGDGFWLGVPDTTWFWLCITAAILHQVLTWLVWRAQLGWGLFTRLFGKYDLMVWGGMFLPLLAARPILVFALAMSDRGSLAWPSWISVSLGIILLLPCLYTLWSVARYFGIPRAMGGDHFRSHYREMPWVREGAFAWSSNAMYTFGFLGLWVIALLLESRAALCAAFFQYAYIWVHHHTTEKPDAGLIYGTP